MRISPSFAVLSLLAVATLAAPGASGSALAGFAAPGARHAAPASAHRPAGAVARRHLARHGARHGLGHAWKRRHGRDLVVGGLAPWGWWGWGDAPPVYAAPEQAAPSLPAALRPGVPTVLDLPEATGVWSSPPARPAIYVVHAEGGAAKGRASKGPRIAPVDDGAGRGAEERRGGPRIIHVSVPRGR